MKRQTGKSSRTARRQRAAAPTSKRAHTHTPKRARAGTTSSKRRRRAQPMQLGLVARSRGGWRAGAGRPRGRSGHYIPHVERARVDKSMPVHVTLKCVEGLPSLRVVQRRRVILRVFADEGACKGFRLVHYSIRNDHLHLVCEADTTLALSRGIQRVASRIARLLNKQLERRGRFFADRFHARVARTPRDMRNVLSYVYLNLHKDEARRGVRVLGPDSCSSHRWFDGWQLPGGQLDGGQRDGGQKRDFVEPASRDPVTRPESWLLRVGWRRHGLIRLDERAPP